DWKAGQTVLAPTFNHQHVLISGNQSAVGVIYMYHIAAQSLMTTFNGRMHEDAHTALAQNHLLCAGQRRHVSGDRIDVPCFQVNALACAQDDCQLFAATKSIVYCYDIHNGQIVDVLDCQLPFAVFNIKISSDNFFLFSGCGPRVDVWHIQKRVHDAPDASGHMGFVTAIALSGDDKIAACGTYDGVVAVWDLDICQCLSTVPQSKGIPVSCLAFSFNQTFLLSGNTIGSVSVFDCSSGTLHRTFSVPALHGDRVDLSAGELPGVQLRQGGQTLSVGDFRRRGEHGENFCPLFTKTDQCASKWNPGNCFCGNNVGRRLQDGRVMMTQGVAPPIFAPPNGKLVVGHCPKNSKEMKVWTVGEEGPVLKNKLSHNEEITCFAAIALGTLVATGSSDQSCKLWQIDSGYLTQVLVGHEGRVTCVALADDERLVISGAEDKKVRCCE
ncbi:WD domain, G-beta repeat protein, partial [Ostertagia ostertagi]